MQCRRTLFVAYSSSDDDESNVSVAAPVYEPASPQSNDEQRIVPMYEPGLPPPASPNFEPTSSINGDGYEYEVSTMRQINTFDKIFHAFNYYN